MPFLQIHTSRKLSFDERGRFGAALAQAYGEYMSTDSRIVNVGFVPYEDGSPARYDAAAEASREMLIVTCDVRSGRAADVLERFGRALTALCAGAYNISELQVAVYITEHHAHEIYRDGGRAPDWSASERHRE